MTAPRRAHFRRIAPALLAALAGTLLSGSPAVGDEASPPPSLPAYLRGIDLNQPAQAAFSEWPPQSLIDRSYWLPWSTLSIQRAVIFNQPVFLLVTVPWSRAAQRMAAETLADPVVLRALNHDYVSILVSADRRPDIYARYGTGNWPAISLLLPDGAPMLSQANDQGKALPITLGPTTTKEVLFYLGEGRKYFDGWQDVLQGVSQVYEKRVDLEDSSSGSVGPKAIDPVVRWLLGNVDAKNGGFGPAPKYVLPGLMEWAFLREDSGRAGLVEPARSTLKKLAAGPLCDTREGGFHRMAAAPDWGAIQYEKMLEGNVELIRELVFAVKEQDDPALRSALRATARFVTTVLARPSGGFYLGQIADPSSPDGGGYWRSATIDPAKAPPVDKLVLAGPNAMAGAALLRAGALLGDPELERTGRAALDLVLVSAVASGRGVDHVVDSEVDRGGRYLVTQSKVALSFVDGYEATGDARYLAAAKDIAVFVRSNMKVGKETAFRDHLTVGPEFGLLDMPLRPMQDNARLARVLIRLAAQGVLEDGRTTAQEVLETYAGDLAVHGVRALEPGLAIDELLSEPLFVTLEGPVDDPRARDLRRAALNLKHGWVVIKTVPAGTPAATLVWRGGKRRVTDPTAMAGQLKGLVQAGVGKL
jgi:uncharacterized protein YyaL (SSP411 family)